MNPSLSRDGRLVAFQSSGALVPEDLDASFNDIYLHDLLKGRTSEVTVTDPSFESNTSITDPSISADGSRIAFQSVVVDYPFFDTIHVHVMDRRYGVTSALLSRRRGAPGNDDSSAPSISATGSLVAFESIATNLVTPDENSTGDVFVHTSGSKPFEELEVPLDR
jgi:Tol biopolymer transport system component